MSAPLHLDLNLLLVFQAVHRERSVSKAADRLALSQPAVSHALNRLRLAVGDKLFVRTAQGMLATPRADSLAGPVQQALDSIRLALAPETFNPAEAELHFTVAMNNYSAVVLAAGIAALCVTQAPHIRLSFRPSGTLNVIDMLDRGDIDLVISGTGAPAERFAATSLIEDHYVLAMRREHPHASLELTTAALSRMSWLSISSSGENVDFLPATLAAEGLPFDAAMDAPYLSTGAILMQSDMVALLGQKIAEEFRRTCAVQIRDLPFASPRLQTWMLWHKRFHDQPGHRWLRETIRTAASAV